MAATKNPNQALPANPPVVTKDSVFGAGEKITHEWPLGTQADIDALYEAYQTLMNNGANIGQVTYQNKLGRGSLVVRFGREGSDIEGEPGTVAMVEELIAVDVIRDICENEYFDSLTDDQVAEVRRAAEEYYDQAEITSRAGKASLGGGTAWASWSTLMKELRYHMIHGQTSYYDTGFILRRSRFSVRTAETLLTFNGINEVQTEKVEFKTDMLQLLQSLPTGEWLYRPPTAEFLGRGRWKTTQEWHWAKKWSKIYGGTWGL